MQSVNSRMQFRDDTGITCFMKQMLHISDQNQKNQDIRAVVRKHSLFFIALSTRRNSTHLQFLKLRAVPKDDSEITNSFLTQSLVLSKDRTLNTDSKTTFNILGIYHVARKIGLPLFFGEQEWRFNHRNTEKQMMDKVAK